MTMTKFMMKTMLTKMMFNIIVPNRDKMMQIDEVDKDGVEDDDDDQDDDTDQPNRDKMQSKDDIDSRVPVAERSKHLKMRL